MCFVGQELAGLEPRMTLRRVAVVCAVFAMGVGAGWLVHRATGLTEGRAVRSVRTDLCGRWSLRPLSGQSVHLLLQADGTFHLEHSFPRYPVSTHQEGTWSADREVLVLRVERNDGVSIGDRPWLRYFRIEPDGRLRAPWWRPDLPYLGTLKKASGVEPARKRAKGRK